MMKVFIGNRFYKHLFIPDDGRCGDHYIDELSIDGNPYEYKNISDNFLGDIARNVFFQKLDKNDVKFIPYDKYLMEKFNDIYNKIEQYYKGYWEIKVNENDNHPLCPARDYEFLLMKIRELSPIRKIVKIKNEKS
jgi:hypothetical protein